MALGGTVRHNLERLEGALRLHPKELMAAHLRSINRTVSHVRTQGVREMGALLPGLERAAVRRQTKLTLARQAAPRAVVEFSAKRFRLFGNFVTPGTRAGVRPRRMPWRIESLGGTTVPPAALGRAFLARGRTSGVPNVWIRVGAKRYPITALLASSLATAFRARGIGERLVRLGRARREIVFEQEMKFRLAKRSAR
jgi:hypothetical protein